MKDIKKPFPIKNWKEDDRPREKLLQKGKEALSDSELIAILIGSGSRSESAVALSQRILTSVENRLIELGKLQIEDLMVFHGIGQAKALSIVAAMELARRRKLEPLKRKQKVNASRIVFEIMQPILGELPHEEFWVLYLNNANNIISMEGLSKGGITGTLIDIRLLLKKALQHNAVGLILAHNHPSGSLKPSKEDKNITQKIKIAAQSLDIKVLDHLIIAESGYFSFSDENLL